MRLPIMYTMSWPERVPVKDATWPRLDFTKANNLTFRAPDRCGASSQHWGSNGVVVAGVVRGGACLTTTCEDWHGRHPVPPQAPHVLHAARLTNT